MCGGQSVVPSVWWTECGGQSVVDRVWCQLGIAEATSDGLIGDLGACAAADQSRAEVGISLSPAFLEIEFGIARAESTVFDAEHWQ